MKRVVTLFEQGDHSWRVVARDPMRQPHLIDTNEFVIESGGEAMVTDPGGQEIFPAVFSALSADFDPRKVKTIFASHQDPDVISSLALWLAFNPRIRCYASWLWSQFIPHFGGDGETIISLPDEPPPSHFRALLFCRSFKGIREKFFQGPEKSNLMAASFRA